MKVEVCYRKDKIKKRWEPKNLKSERDHVVWTFWSGSYHFSCICFSFNKRRRPKRIFSEFSIHRPSYRHYLSYIRMDVFEVEEEIIYRKINESKN